MGLREKNNDDKNNKDKNKKDKNNENIYREKNKKNNNEIMNKEKPGKRIKNKDSKNKEKRNKAKNKNSKVKFPSSIILIISILISILLGYILYQQENKINNESEMSYTELITKIEENNVEKVELTVDSTNATVKIKDDEKDKKVSLPDTSAFMELIQIKIQNGNSIELIQKENSIIIKTLKTLITFLPTLILISLIFYLVKMQGFGGKGKIFDAETQETITKFDDVAGLDEEKQEMIEIVNFLKKPEKFHEMGAKVPRGVLLCGNPGTGKTLIAKAIAGEADVPFISMSGSEFIEMFAGLGASRVRSLFEKARKIAPCIIFIDEIDAIGSRRTSSSGAETENNQTLNQLLVEMDGFDTEETIIVLAATNRPEMLDKALLRPGRFDRQITIALPDLNGREAILNIHAKGKKFSEDVNLRSIAEDTAGFTGAELANILNESAIIATIKEQQFITNQDIEDAVKKVTVGIEKTSRVVSDKDKKLTAFHEAGHAVVSSFLETQKDIKEVSIIPRGVAGGYTMYKTNEDKFYISKTEMEEKLIALLGGRVAEKLALNDISTGASNDIEVATAIAKDMVTKYGMSEKIGPVSIDLEKDPYQMQLFGDDFGDRIGEEVKFILDKAYRNAQTILVGNMDKLTNVAKVLLQKEVISASEFEQIMSFEG
ncbi:MAG TPA: ATP-dependent zinc metalloprotease FtsH [Clostridia bacterium]|nr:ATP-dependent zinc metalloprotease FtsH [Clostridia bacterium]